MDKKKHNKIFREISNVAMLIICVVFGVGMTMGIIFAITILSQLIRG